MILWAPLMGQAAAHKILDITSDGDKTFLSKIDVDMNDKNIATKLNYIPTNESEKLQSYSTENLLKNKITLLSEKGVEIVGLKLQKINATQFVAVLHYLYQFKLFNRIYKDKKIVIYYSTPDNRYLAHDPEIKRTVSRLHFLVNYNDRGKQVGISKIETL